MMLANETAKPVSVLPAWTRRIDRWEAATGLFVLAVVIGGRYLGETVHEYASHIVLLTIICELSMVWAAIGSAATLQAKNAFYLSAGIAFALGLYFMSVIGIIWKSQEFYIIPQALWILYGRFRPRSGDAWFGEDNLTRFMLVAVAGFVCVFVQFLLYFMVTVALATFFNISEDYGDGVMGAPRWVSAMMWVLFYFELAVLLPKVEAFARRPKRNARQQQVKASAETPS
jgi:hypothetical protein